MITWFYHVYQLQTGLMWGYGAIKGKYFEYTAKHDPQTDELHINWRTHNDKRELQNIERVMEIALNQRSTEWMCKKIANFEDRMILPLLYDKMVGEPEPAGET